MKSYKIFLFTLPFFLALFLGSALVWAHNSEAIEFSKKSGPIAIRNQMPLYLFYLQMAPDKAEVIEQNKASINADYTVSNVTVSGFTPATSLYDIQIDMEVSRITLDFRYGLYDNLEVGLEVPYISLSKGYLDNFVEGFEDAIGAKTPRSRERQGSYNFNYSLIYNSQSLINKKHSIGGLGDIALNAKYQLLKEGQGGFLPNLSLRGALKFPTAEKDDLLGSGEFDYGLGLLIDKVFFERLYIYGGCNVVRIQKPSFFSMLDIDQEIFSGVLAAEYFFTKKVSLVAQVTGNSTPYPSSGTNAMDNSAYEFGFGFNYRCKEKEDVVLSFAVIENIESASSPDASFNLGLKAGF